MNKEEKPTLDWVLTRAPWDAFGTFTFRGGKTPAARVESKINTFLQEKIPTASYFYVIEKHNPLGRMKRDEINNRPSPGYHAHLLLHFGKKLAAQLTTNVKRTYTNEQARAAGHRRRWMPYDKLWKVAFKKFGRCEFRPLQNLEDVTSYICKRIVDYQTKEVECAEHGLRYGNGYQGRMDSQNAPGVIDEDRILQVGTP